MALFPALSHRALLRCPFQPKLAAKEAFIYG